MGSDAGATYASDRDHVRERLSGRIVESRTRSTVDQSRCGSTWNFDWLFKAQQYGRCEVRVFVHKATVRGISHMCDSFYGSEIDVNGDGDKKKSRAKTDLANIREREGRRQWPRGRTISSTFFPLCLHVSRNECLQPLSGAPPDTDVFSLVNKTYGRFVPPS